MRNPNSRPPKVAGIPINNSLDPTLPTSWIEIHPDNTSPDSHRQERFRPEHHIHRVPADRRRGTERAPSKLSPPSSWATPIARPMAAAPSIFSATARRTSAKPRPTPIRLCSIWPRNAWASRKSELSVKDGIVSGGGKSISYGDLVKGQQLKLTIPVRGNLTGIAGLTITGNPPMKPVSQYTIIGKSYRNTVTESKVTARETWATDVRLPGMLHARMVHPKTLGSTLVSAGAARQDPLSQRAGRRQRQSGWRRRPHRVGSHQRRAAGSQRHQMDRLERPARHRQPAQISATKRTGKQRPSPRATKQR